MAPVVSCKAAGDDAKHAKRKLFLGGYCHTCHYARKRGRRRARRLSAVRTVYGLTEADLEALRVAQRGRCAICRRRVGVVKAGAVDHDHRLEAVGLPKRATVRGILCGTCNQWLGHTGDDPVAAIRAAAYLIDPPAPKVLTRLDKLRQDEHATPERPEHSPAGPE